MGVCFTSKKTRRICLALNNFFTPPPPQPNFSGFRWEEKELPDGIKWRSLSHHGPCFPPDYEPLPDNVHLLYDGEGRGRYLLLLHPVALRSHLGILAAVSDRQAYETGAGRRGGGRVLRDDADGELKPHPTSLTSCPFPK